jgi:uncharacterized protein YjgD (DUF1641 family)
MINQPVQNKLEQPEVQEAIVSFLQNLPKYERQLEQLGLLMNFGQAILADKQTLSSYDEKLRTYNINLETIQAAIGLLEKLPRLLERIEQLENLLDFMESIYTDETTMQQISDTIKGYTEPFVEKGQNGISLLKEIRQEAENHQEPIKLTTIYKWLKDPSVQKTLQYVQATLTVLNKKS